MYNLVCTLAPSFLIESSLFLQVKRITIISRMTSNFGPILSGTAELAVLERLKKSRRLIIGKILLALYSLHFYWIFFVFAGNEDNHKSLDTF